MFSFFNIKSKPSAEEKLLKEKINNYTRLSLKNMSDKFEIAKGISQYDSNIDPLKLINDIIMEKDIEDFAVNQLRDEAEMLKLDIDLLIPLFIKYNKYFNLNLNARTYIYECKYGKLKLESHGDYYNMISRVRGQVSSWVTGALVRGATDEEILYVVNNNELLLNYQHANDLSFGTILKYSYTCAISDYTRFVIFSLNYSDKEKCDEAINDLNKRFAPYVRKDTLASVVKEYKKEMNTRLLEAINK